VVESAGRVARVEWIQYKRRPVWRIRWRNTRKYPFDRPRSSWRDNIKIVRKDVSSYDVMRTELIKMESGSEVWFERCVSLRLF
jgi:hypothetical protein